MNLVDSSGWFEYFMNSANARYFSDVIEKTDELLVSPLNYFEIYRSIFLRFGHEDANRAIAFLNHARTVDISTPIALEAAELSNTFHLHFADSLLLATAYSQEATFWTMDAHFKDIPGVEYFEKE